MNTQPFFCLNRPLHELPAQSQVSASNLQNFPELVRRLGGDHRSIMERYGIDPKVVDGSDGFVDCQPFVSMYEYCASEFGDPLFGFHLAELQEPDVYGFVAALCRYAPNFREAVNCLVDFIPVVHSSESVLELVEGQHIAELRWSERSNMGANDQANCQGLLLNLKVLRVAGGAQFMPSYITLPPAVFRALTPEIKKTIGCEVRQSADRGRIAFPAAMLEAKVPSANQPLFQLLRGYLSGLKSAPTQSIADKVDSYVSNTLGVGDFSIEACAQQLKISVRTLQAKLHAENKSFSDILDAQRLDKARQILLSSELTVAEVADLLGYSERTSFGRAFKRWTGVSPQQFRLRGASYLIK